MKTLKFTTILLIGMMMTGLNTMAQHHGQSSDSEQGKGCQMKEACCGEIPNLTDEQKGKVEALKLTHQKEMLAIHNQMRELKAKERTLSTAEKPDMKAINANIDEMTKLQNQMMKKQAQHRQNMRALLTDEQKIWFDTHVGKGKHHGKGEMRCKMQNEHHTQRDSTQCPMMKKAEQ